MSNTPHSPAVTVFMPMYNAALYLDEAIESILDQTFTDFEFLIIDDGSTDDSLAVAKRHAAADARIRLLVNAANLGQPATRNRGLVESRGRYIAFMDADDRARSDRLAQQVAYLAEHPEVDVVGSRSAPMTADGQVQAVNPRQRQDYSSDEIAARMLFNCPIHHPTLMARADVMTAHRYDPDFTVAQDHELWARMALDHRFDVLDAELFEYRQHDKQAIAGLDAIIEGRHRIHARELEAMGMEFSSADLRRHYHLFHFKGRDLFEAQFGTPLDRCFLQWARRWMETLVAANREVRRYPEPEFSHYVAARWLFLCRKTAGTDLSAFSVLREFFGSALRPVVASAFRARALDPR